MGEAGHSVLSKESMFKDMLTGARLLKGVPPTDAAAGQKDLHHLTVHQLLRIRVLNLDFAPGGNGSHAAFLSTLDDLICKRLGQIAASSRDRSQSGNAICLGRDLVLAIAASKVVSTPRHWLCWYGSRRIFFHMDRLACTSCCDAAFEDGGVLEFDDK